MTSKTGGRQGITIDVVTPAGPGHQVVSVRHDDPAHRQYRRKPCAECPWRRDTQVGDFPAEAFRISARTAYDCSERVFGCHMSGIQRPQVCAGFLLANADNNIAVRLAQIRGHLDMDDIHAGGAELYNSYREMAVANGVDPDDPMIAACRANDE